ncbi:hypothetical protein HELRODRAFT_162846 [Helobdella robusta]|uniref:Ion transport domain-containing protein n=1 Tax=Helobdella robusta TaxID=6412 RepID=T1ET94_HELRO|nr:hypothetical protein HELRODRAFT_162846 [Helobdella robusta]ESN99323.1 hypothetical protein HELRODRAFT_162846 [Helobdella robusta]
MSESKRLEQEELDLRCLQLLRTIIHNEERKLPEDWEENPSDNKKQMAVIRNLQVELNDMGAVITALPHLAKPSDRMAKEVLAFLCIMLFNANEKIQSSLLQYFLHTREESFFAAIRNRMHLSALAIKEKRSLLAQHRARAKEVMAQSKSMLTTMAIEKKTLQEIQAVDLALKKDRIATRMNGVADNLYNEQLPDKLTAMGDENLLVGCGADEIEKMFLQKEKKQLKSKQDRKKFSNNLKKDGKLKQMSSSLSPQSDLYKDTVIVNIDDNHQEDDQQDLDNIQNDGMDDEDEDDLSNLDQKNGGCIGVVLRVLARMCDGQHAGLQGNQLNRSVMLNSKVVDYINFILRAAEFSGCSLNKILSLKMSIGNLVLAMIEENTPESLIVAKVVAFYIFILFLVLLNLALTVLKEVKDTMDKEAVYRCMTQCYESCLSDRTKLDSLKGNLSMKAIQAAKDLPKFAKRQDDDSRTPELKEKLDEVGFVYYLILARIYDIDPKLGNNVNLTEMQQESFNHYRKNTMSIEILKDSNLQKINFRNVLRNEIKEKLTWNVDRSSPSNKIRDLMKWSKDILIDIYYQRKILSNPLATFLTKNWLLWNRLVIILSLILNIFMLATWNASMSLADLPGSKNLTDLPDELYKVHVRNHPHPHCSLPTSAPAKRQPKSCLKLEEYSTVIYSLGGVHCFFSFLVLLTYFLSNHPTLPSFSAIKQKFAKCGWKKKKKKGTDSEEEEEKEHESKLEVKFLSFTTLYYLVFLGMSVAGIVFQEGKGSSWIKSLCMKFCVCVMYGYFFAFHLLNIVNNNQLLRGVIQAVTLNGKSLLWVAVLGLVVFYLYGLVSFALMRTSFDPENELYCSTLWQCTVSVVHYGLVGDIFSKVVSHPAENTFYRFGFLVLFHMSFFIFITTIGLNIIFGIIVDTFSELRNLKWTAERDMIDTCFICSRSSYDFEHHGQDLTDAETVTACKAVKQN